MSVHGYQEEGTITTPFDMRVQNEIDRFNLVKDAIMHLPQLGNRGSYLIQKMNDKFVEHKQYIAEYGQDLEEVRVLWMFLLYRKVLGLPQDDRRVIMIIIG